MRPLRKRDELQEFFLTFEEAVNALRARDDATVQAIDQAMTAASQAGDKETATRILGEMLIKHKELLTKALG